MITALAPAPAPAARPAVSGHYVVVPLADGRWGVGHRLPGQSAVAIDVECLTLDAAERERAWLEFDRARESAWVADDRALRGLS